MLLIGGGASAASLRDGGAPDRIALTEERAKFSNQSALSVENGTLHTIVKSGQHTEGSACVTVVPFLLMASHTGETFTRRGDPHGYIVSH